MARGPGAVAFGARRASTRSSRRPRRSKSAAELSVCSWDRARLTCNVSTASRPSTNPLRGIATAG